MKSTHDLEVIRLKPSTSVLSRTWSTNMYIGIMGTLIGLSLIWRCPGLLQRRDHVIEKPTFLRKPDQKHWAYSNWWSWYARNPCHPCHYLWWNLCQEQLVLGISLAISLPFVAHYCYQFVLLIDHRFFLHTDGRDILYSWIVAGLFLGLLSRTFGERTKCYKHIPKLVIPLSDAQMS